MSTDFNCLTKIELTNLCKERNIKISKYYKKNNLIDLLNGKEIEKKFKCDECGSMFITNGYLKQHNERIHSEKLTNNKYIGLLNHTEDLHEKSKEKWKKIFVEGFSYCSRCEKRLEINKFRILKNRSYPYLNSMCRDCDNLRTNNFKKNKSETIEGKAYILFSNVKRRCSDKELECEIDENYIIDLHKKQNGLCHYTGIEMQLSSTDKSENRKNIILL